MLSATENVGIPLAGEPTGELDSSTAQDVFSARRIANTELGATVLIVTHDPAVSPQVRRTIAIRDSKTSSETIRHSATDDEGTTTLHVREYRAGRVQLSREMTRRPRMRNRVGLQEVSGHIGVWADQAGDGQTPSATVNRVSLGAAARIEPSAEAPSGVARQVR
jgi:ABC-type multidrug transport system ATPase subunit